MKITINVLLVAAVVSFAKCFEEFPSNIERCKYEDEECLVNAWNKYTKMGNIEGVPGLVPQLKETHIEKLVVNVGSNSLNFKILFTNVTVTGLGSTKYEKIKGFKRDPKTMTKIEITGASPLIGLLGQYEARGKLLLVPLTGKGESELKYFNVKFKITAYTKTEQKDGEEYLVITKVDCSYERERNHYRYENILNNKELSDGVNKMLNENPDIFDNDVKEPTQKTFAKVFKETIAPIFKRYPYRSFFLD